MRTLLPAALLALVLLDTSVAAAQQVASKFEFDLPSLGGQPLSHQQFERSLLLVDYFGTWSAPSSRTVPMLQELYRKYKHHGLEVVGFAYENADGVGDPLDRVRDFAIRHSVTYPLALGTPAEKKLVKGFRAYPTLLLFKPGFAYDRRILGFRESDPRTLENWVRSELRLEPLVEPDIEPPEPEQPAPDGDAEPPPPDDFGDPQDASTLPAGVIFKPGQGDSGFEFEVEDDAGKTIQFTALAGKPVVLAITSTWDAAAIDTAAFITAIHLAAGDDAHVLAASLENKRQLAMKIAAIRKFRKEHDLQYQIFPAGLAFQKKIHLFTGMPMILVFDSSGVLVLRENNTSDETLEAVKGLLGDD